MKINLPIYQVLETYRVERKDGRTFDLEIQESETLADMQMKDYRLQVFESFDGKPRRPSKSGVIHNGPRDAFLAKGMRWIEAVK